ncbi:MAG: hypothetical protein A2341_09010 [Deltaproteobacteria bacterium RIFOXYB12_FULL_58_9]|nr:MAG: hypothetical protein A2341_09010 [Deltaproteobacteria bacterium RIFOXYB12_FULL_58_9]
MSEPLVQLVDVGMRFRLHYEKAFTLKETMINLVKRRNNYSDLWALRGVSLDVREGEAVGIVGRNGSGKSTLLKILARVFEPTEGKCILRGSVSALIELGAGFNAELTGRENVFLNGAIMGLSRAEMERRYDQIVDFAELHDFMDTAVKNYSSGMYARLGFAIATDVDGDILLIDEILGVGDEGFQKKCFARIQQHLDGGKTVLLVSHDPDAIERICHRAVLLHNGKVVFAGSAAETLTRYREILAMERSPS